MAHVAALCRCWSPGQGPKKLLVSPNDHVLEASKMIGLIFNGVRSYLTAINEEEKVWRA